MADLVEFLRARYDEEQALAERSGERVREEDQNEALHSAYCIWMDGVCCCSGPAELLTEVAAKRAVVDQCSISLTQLGNPPVPRGQSAHWALATLVLEALAQPYRYRHDFNLAWASAVSA